MLNNSRGFSLIEIVIFIVIVGVAVAGITVQFSQNVAHSADPLLRQKTLALANGIMDEIVRKRWDENSPIGGGCVATGSGSCATGPAVSTPLGADGESRADYDDIDDYDAITNQSPPQDPTGTAISAYNGYTLSISVGYPAANWNGINSADVKQIDLALTNPIGETITFTMLRVNF